MPSRREFLQAGLAASMLPRTIPESHSVPAASETSAAMPGAHSIYKVISDIRFPQSVAFGLEAQRLGAQLVRISGDITDIWFNDLSVRWKEQPVAIAGLTAHGPVFCLERLAWDHGMRVVFRGEHRVLDHGRIEHSMSGPQPTIARARSLALDGPQWGTRVAHVVTACQAWHGVSESAIMTTPSNHGADEAVEPLVSWVIAPVSRS